MIMLNKIILFISLFALGSIYSQTASEVMEQVGKQYSIVQPLQYNSSYALYKSANSKNVEQAYKGIFVKNAFNEVYMKIDQTEILNSKTVNIKISHSEKAIQIADPLKNYFGSLDVKPLFDLCKVESFKDFKTYWEIVLTAKNYSSLPYSKIVLQITKKYFLQKSTFFYSTAVNFSKDYKTPKNYHPRLEVSNTNFNRRAVNASLFVTKSYLTAAGKNKFQPAQNIKDYEIIDQRTISN